VALTFACKDSDLDDHRQPRPQSPCQRQGEDENRSPCCCASSPSRLLRSCALWGLSTDTSWGSRAASAACTATGSLPRGSPGFRPTSMLPGGVPGLRRRKVSRVVIRFAVGTKRGPRPNQAAPSHAATRLCRPPRFNGAAFAETTRPPGPNSSLDCSSKRTRPLLGEAPGS